MNVIKYSTITILNYGCGMYIIRCHCMWECKQNHVSDVNKIITTHISFCMQIFRNLMTKSCSNKTIEYTYGANFPEFQI